MNYLDNTLGNMRVDINAPFNEFNINSETIKHIKNILEYSEKLYFVSSSPSFREEENKQWIFRFIFKTI